MTSLKEAFLLDPHVTFLNHGSFGAVPATVLEEYQSWQRRLERQPVLFLGREYNDLLRTSRCALGAYLNVDPDDLAYIPNATHGVNILARSLDLQPGDEILTSDHEYGACNYAWEFACQKTGAVYVQQSIPLPVETADGMADTFWRGITPHTKVIYLSHITSPTALRLPVEDICQRARQAGILTIIDAAHSPGQIPVDLHMLGADLVFGNCHKWMLAPKGAAFLYASRDSQQWIEPLIVSWGYQPAPGTSSGSRFIDLLQWTGTNDPAAALSVPAAIQFMQKNNWPEVRRNCHQLLAQAIQRICKLTGLPPLYPLDSDLFSQMGIAPLPANTDLERLKKRLYEVYGVEVPLMAWRDLKLMRISVQGYNTQEDIDRLLLALEELLPQVQTESDNGASAV
jgi:isopenicillin-N epimerase